MTKVSLSNELVRALNAVNQDVAADVTFERGTSYETKLLIIAETCLDANRMTMAGYPKEDAEFHRLVEVHGYDAVLKAAAEVVSVA